MSVVLVPLAARLAGGVASRVVASAGSSGMTPEAVWRTLTLQGGRLSVLVLLGTALLGIAGGLVGTLLLLRKRSLMGDAISHATLPGIAAVFLLAVGAGWNPRSAPLLMLGGAATAVLAVLAIQGLLRFTRLREDAAIASVLSVFFGAGVVLMTIVQRSSSGLQSGLREYTLGQAAAMRVEDVWVMGALALASALVAAALFKELVLVCFNDEFARAAGWPVGVLDLVVMTLVVVVTLAGMQQVGLVLVIAMLIVPAAAARFWSDRAGVVMGLAAVLGGLAGYVGAAISAVRPGAPTGPVIVLTAGAVFVVSLLAAPRRGVAAVAVRRATMRLGVAMDHRVVRMAASGAADPGAPAWLAAAMRARGLTRRERGGVRLTGAGAARAARVAAARAAWEELVTRQAGVSPSHAGVSADLMEHVLAKRRGDAEGTGVPPTAAGHSRQGQQAGSEGEA